MNKPITIITGHYGSGKTNLAVNLALSFKKAGGSVTVADLDVVNPYFRTADFRALFNDWGIRLAASDFAGSSLDVPSVNLDVKGALSRSDRLIIDAGGDPEGARVLGRFAPALDELGYEMIYVINQSRIQTQTAGQAVQIMKSIEKSCTLKCTAIFNNTNLGRQTTEEIVTQSIPFALEVARITRLPLLKLPDIEVYVKPIWEV
jgi:MinD superfamily P-loop ATPase